MIGSTKTSLTHCRLNRLFPYYILEDTFFDFRYVSKLIELFANSGDPDQTPRFAASDQGLHCLPFTNFAGCPKVVLLL